MEVSNQTMLYKEEKSLEERKTESQTMLERFPDRVPVIVEKRRTCVATIDKRKFMAPRSLSVGQLVFVIRRRLKMKSSDAVFIFIAKRLADQNAMLNETYSRYGDEDGFLYVVYDFENTFG